jgi:hypothetical protein
MFQVSNLSLQAPMFRLEDCGLAVHAEAGHERLTLNDIAIAFSTLLESNFG